METSILAAAEAEQQLLEKQLAKIDADYAAKRKAVIDRLDAVKALLLVYGVDHRVMKEQAVFRTAGIFYTPPRDNSHKARVLNAALDILKDGASIPTRELLALIEARGVVFNAADKVGSLSVTLSKDDRFVSDRRAGWSLAQKNPQDAATSAGSLPT